MLPLLNKQQEDTADILKLMKYGFALIHQTTIDQIERQHRLFNINRRLYRLLYHIVGLIHTWRDDTKNSFKELEAHDEKLDAILDENQNIFQSLENLEGLVHPCGGAGWTPVVNLDMSDPNQDCPAGYALVPNITVRACGRKNTNSYMPPCDVATFTTDRSYSKVCGRVKGYQIGSANAFSSHIPTINFHVHGFYVGYATTASAPPGHIWTFAVGSTDGDPTSDTVCPCASDGGPYLRPAPFTVGNDYFCESGNKDPIAIDDKFYSDALWDGKNCFGESECCAFNHPPYFVKDLGSQTSGNIVAGICTQENYGNVAIQLLEIYVQ